MSDSEGELHDLDEEQNVFASGDIPKLQLRKVVSKAQWISDLGMAEVVERKGRLWTTTGIVRNGKIYCLIEETLYLAEIGALHLLDGDDLALPLRDIYAKVLDNKNGCCWEAFEVYKHLKSLGYIVGRHGKPWSMKSDELNSLSPQAATESDEQVDEKSEQNVCLTEMFSCIQINQVRPFYNVYLPNGKFRKSSPDPPLFVLCISSGRPPLKQEIEELERRCYGCPLKFCNVEPGGRAFLEIQGCLIETTANSKQEELEENAKTTVDDDFKILTEEDLNGRMSYMGIFMWLSFLRRTS